MKLVLGWIKTHFVTSIAIGTIVVGGAVATSIILLNSNDNLDSQGIQETDQDKQDIIDNEPVLNEDGCPVGEFLNYYGICQDEHLYDPQECPAGQEWLPNLYVNKDNGDGTASVDYEATYGIDGLPKGGCANTYETMCEIYANTPGAAPCSTTKYGLEEKQSYENRTKCGRGELFLDGVCTDNSAFHRRTYEERVLGWPEEESADYASKKAQEVN